MASSYLLFFYFVSMSRRTEMREVVISEGARVLETNAGLAPELMDGMARVRAAVGGVSQELLALSDGSFVKVHPYGSKEFPQTSPSGKHVYLDAAAADRAARNRGHRAVRAASHNLARNARFAEMPEPRAKADLWTSVTDNDLIVGGME